MSPQRLTSAPVRASCTRDGERTDERRALGEVHRHPVCGSDCVSAQAPGLALHSDALHGVTAPGDALSDVGLSCPQAVKYGHLHPQLPISLHCQLHRNRVTGHGWWWTRVVCCSARISLASPIKECRQRVTRRSGQGRQSRRGRRRSVKISGSASPRMPPVARRGRRWERWRWRGRWWPACRGSSGRRVIAVVVAVGVRQKTRQRGDVVIVRALRYNCSRSTCRRHGLSHCEGASAPKPHQDGGRGHAAPIGIAKPGIWACRPPAGRQPCPNRQFAY
jgi:hypothetical protein